MGRPVSVINEIVHGTKIITADTALDLEQALDIPAETWLKMEAAYRLEEARNRKQDAGIDRKRRLYALAPVTELVRRGWIPGSKSLDELEKQVFQHLGIASYEETPALAINLRSQNEEGISRSALASWEKRVVHLAKQQTLPAYDRERMRVALTKIVACTEHAAHVAHIPFLLAEAGVHFLIVPHLDRTFLDGAVVEVEGRPVIALTLRRDRIDSFWFSFFHEAAHVVQKHTSFHFDNLEDTTRKSKQEEDADRLSRDLLLSQEALQSFTRLTAPYFSKARIERFAKEQRRHPGIILGRLQREGLVDWSHLRGLLVNVRPHLENLIDVAPISKLSA